MDTRIDVSIIIPVYKNFNLLNNLLSTLLPTIDNKCEIIIVDDGPCDCKLDTKILSPDIIYISNDINKGYAYSVNRGISIAQGKIITTINSDICVEQGWLERTRNAFETHIDMGVLGSRLLYPTDGSLHHCGVFFSGINYMHHAFAGNTESPLDTFDIMEVPAATFAFVSFLKADWVKVNGLDEHYYNSHEDIDFCLKIKYLVGKRIYVDNNIIAYHITSASEEQRFVGSNDAAKYFIDRWKNTEENQGREIFEMSKSAYCNNGGIWPTRALTIAIPTRMGHRQCQYYQIFKELSGIEEVAYYQYDSDLENIPRHYQKADINLLKILPFSLLESKWPIIYFVDSYRNLKENYYWQLKRKNKNDMIFD
ncbi:MAG: glycosyltransferase, partial [Alistipes sp.]|nr:glycosyltransferase [Alistipes sp.]